MANPESSSPSRNPPFRIGNLPGFVVLSDDNMVSTRGQKLPSLIQSRSTATLTEMRGQFVQKRRSSSQERGGEEDLERGADGDDRRGSREYMEFGRERSGMGLDRKMSSGAEVLMTPQMRSMRLIGNSNPRYNWAQYNKSEEQLKRMEKPIRKYYERNNMLIAQYQYIDRLLDSSLPHNLIQEYHHQSQFPVDIPRTIDEEGSPTNDQDANGLTETNGSAATSKSKVKRTPKALYSIPNEDTPLLGEGTSNEIKVPQVSGEAERDLDSNSPIVTIAIYINLAANAILLCGKIAVIILTSSLSVLASLVDAALDFLSTAIVWTTTKLIARSDEYAYPVGRRRLEPLGVLVFSVVMVTAFFQVALECINRLTSGDHSIVQLTLPAILIMASTVLIKFGCWLWCRLIKNSSVQALAQDAITDVVFNIFSIIFPLIGYYLSIWYLDALGGLLLSLYVILNWARTSFAHIRNLTGAAATADERNVLLYLTMRFAVPIKAIQGLAAYHAGDRLNVEVDLVLDEGMRLRDSHDLGESLQYVLESVPSVERAFVHLDYRGDNLPGHMRQGGDEE